MAREHAPSIIFMDEIDSIGSSRGESGSGGGDSEVQRTMLELLNQLDGFEATKNIKVRSTRFSGGLQLLKAEADEPSHPSCRSSWPPIELISWIQPSCDLDELTERLNSLHPGKSHHHPC